jgi:hypothetical protein
MATTAAGVVCLTLCAILLPGCDQSADVDVTGTWSANQEFVQDSEPGFDPDDATISFAGNGKWKASDGCNGLGGTYDVDGTGWSFESGPHTAKGCVNGYVPYDLLLEDAERVDREDDVLVFYDDSDAALLALTLVKN